MIRRKPAGASTAVSAMLLLVAVTLSQIRWATLAQGLEASRPEAGVSKETGSITVSSTGSKGGSWSGLIMIPDAGGGVAYCGIPVSGAPAGAVIEAIDWQFNIDHDYTRDLEVFLGTSSWNSRHYGDYLAYRHAPTGDDLFDIWDETLALNGTYTSSESWFLGQSVNQTWSLAVEDMVSQDTGSINSWSLTINYRVPPADPEIQDWDCENEPWMWGGTAQIDLDVYNAGGETATCYIKVIASNDMTLWDADDYVIFDWPASIPPGSHWTRVNHTWSLPVSPYPNMPGNGTVYYFAHVGGDYNEFENDGVIMSQASLPPTDTVTPSTTPSSTPTPTQSLTPTDTATPSPTPSTTHTGQPISTITVTPSHTRTRGPSSTPLPTGVPPSRITGSVLVEGGGGLGQCQARVLDKSPERVLLASAVSDPQGQFEITLPFSSEELELELVPAGGYWVHATQMPSGAKLNSTWPWSATISLPEAGGTDLYVWEASIAPMWLPMIVRPAEPTPTPTATPTPTPTSHASDEELSYDDGSAEAWLGGRPYSFMAVRYQPPAGRRLVSVKYRLGWDMAPMRFVIWDDDWAEIYTETATPILESANAWWEWELPSGMYGGSEVYAGYLCLSDYSVSGPAIGFIPTIRTERHLPAPGHPSSARMAMP